MLGQGFKIERLSYTSSSCISHTRPVQLGDKEGARTMLPSTQLQRTESTDQQTLLHSHAVCYGFVMKCISKYYIVKIWVSGSSVKR